MNSASREKMRLTIITNNLYTFGGGEKFALEMATRLKGEFSITIVNTVSDKDEVIMPKSRLHTLYDLNGIRIEELRNVGVGFKAFGTEPYTMRILGPRAAAKLMKIFRNSDVIYQVSLNPVLLSCSVMLSKLLRKKFVLGIHNFSVSKALEGNAGGVNKIASQALRSILSQVSFFHVLNKRDLALIRRQFPSARVRIIENFLTTKHARIVSNTREFICLYVGRLEKNQKGIDLLCDAIECTLANNKEIKFHIVGKGGDGEHLVVELSKKYRKNVKWSGFLTGKDLDDAYREASVLLFPSRYDTFSLVLLEAQSYGLPAITFDIPGPKDIVKKKFQGTKIVGLSAEDFSAQILSYRDAWANKKQYLKLKKRISSYAYMTYPAEKRLKELKAFLSC